MGLHWGCRSEGRQTGREDVGGGRGKINRQLNWKVAEREGEVGARLLETKDKRFTRGSGLGEHERHALPPRSRPTYFLSTY